MANSAQTLGRDKGPVKLDTHSSFLGLDSGLPQLCLSPRGSAKGAEVRGAKGVEEAVTQRTCLPLEPLHTAMTLLKCKLSKASSISHFTQHKSQSLSWP